MHDPDGGSTRVGRDDHSHQAVYCAIVPTCRRQGRETRRPSREGARPEVCGTDVGVSPAAACAQRAWPRWKEHRAEARPCAARFAGAVGDVGQDHPARHCGRGSLLRGGRSARPRTKRSAGRRPVSRFSWQAAAAQPDARSSAATASQPRGRSAGSSDRPRHRARRPRRARASTSHREAPARAGEVDDGDLARRADVLHGSGVHHGVDFSSESLARPEGTSPMLPGRGRRS